MEIYQSEEEQVEAIKRWWRRNGSTVIAAVVVFLLSFAGWRFWMGQQQQEAEAASVAYEQMLSAVESGNAPQARQRGRALIDEYAGTPYAALASLYLARLAVEADDPDGAAAHLQAVIDNPVLEELGYMARMRLARVRLAQGDADAAMAVVGGEAPVGFAGPYAEIRGDIHLARGDRDEARAAYARALEAYTENPERRSLVQMKLDDLAVAGEGGDA